MASPSPSSSLTDRRLVSIRPGAWAGRILEPATFENDLVMMCSHSGTHMDAFNHIGERQPDGRILLYGGKTADEIKEWWGMNWMSGADMVPVICRGIR